MRIVSLIENTKREDRKDLVAEHGLSLYIETDDKHILFDTGASNAFEANAEKLGVDLRDVDLLVISHHHFDHGGGLARFMEINPQAPIYLRKSEAEDFHFRALGIVDRYIGLDQKLLQENTDRFTFVDTFSEVLPGVYILVDIPDKHERPKGNQKLFIKENKSYHNDTFEHELIMVVRDKDGLVVFTGCSHHGILNMVNSVTEQFPGESIKAVFGGFHLIGLPYLNTMAGSKDEVRSIGEELLKYPITQTYTGHCTGEKAYHVLREVMGEKLENFPTGSEVVL